MRPWADRHHRLTGRRRYRAGSQRVGWRSYAPVLVLQVEEVFNHYPVLRPELAGHDLVRWRDARVEDLAPDALLRPDDTTG